MTDCIRELRCSSIAQAINAFSSCCSAMSLYTSHKGINLSFPFTEMRFPGITQMLRQDPGKPFASDMRSLSCNMLTVSQKENLPLIIVSFWRGIPSCFSSLYNVMIVLSGTFSTVPSIKNLLAGTEGVTEHEVVVIAANNAYSNDFINVVLMVMYWQI